MKESRTKIPTSSTEDLFSEQTSGYRKARLCKVFASPLMKRAKMSGLITEHNIELIHWVWRGIWNTSCRPHFGFSLDYVAISYL